MNLVGKLHIDGIFEGRISSVDSIAIGRRGEVTGVIRAQQVSVSGRLDGEVYCDELTVERGGHVRGVVHSRQMTIHKNGNFIGERAMADNLSSSHVIVDPIDAQRSVGSSLTELNSEGQLNADSTDRDSDAIVNDSRVNDGHAFAQKQSGENRKPEQLTRLLDEMLGELPQVGSRKDEANGA